MRRTRGSAPLLLALALAGGLVPAQQPVPPGKEKPPEPVEPLGDFAYRFDFRDGIEYFGEVTVENEYELWDVAFGYKLKLKEHLSTGWWRLTVKVVRWRESVLTAKTKATFDMSREPEPQEEEEFGPLRACLKNDFMSVDISPEGTFSRVLLTEEPYTIVKQKGSRAIEAVRDMLVRTLPLVTGRAAAPGDSWSQTKNPCGWCLPYEFKYRFKVREIDPKKGTASFGLAAPPEFGPGSRLTKDPPKMAESTGEGVFDLRRGRLLDFSVKGGFSATFVVNESSADYTYSYAARIHCR